MARKQYSPQFKVKLVLEVLQGEKELGATAYENDVNPNMLRNWKRKFLESASTVFEDPKKAEKKAKWEEETLKKKASRMLKTIGQLTRERDFLHDYFREVGLPIPELGEEKH